MDAIIIVMGVVTIVIQDVQVRVQIPAKIPAQIYVVIAREAVSITVLPVTVAVKDALEAAGVAAMVHVRVVIPHAQLPVLTIVHMGAKIPVTIYARVPA